MGVKGSCYSKYTTIIHLLLMHTCSLSEDISYSWLQNNDKYDVMVGISVGGKPVSSGIIYSDKYIVTAANPIERVTDISTVKVHAIDGEQNKSKIYNVARITRDQAKRNTGKWATFGFDNRHAPHHDILCLTLATPIEDVNDPKPRFPIAANYGLAPRFHTAGRFAYAGFGFIDKPHVKQNVELELVEYSVETILENCIEWIPLVWGNFICLSNIEHFVGISSGAGLFYNDIFVGIGSFSVKRGSEGILLFTDFRLYNRSIIFED